MSKISIPLEMPDPKKMPDPMAMPDPSVILPVSMPPPQKMPQPKKMMLKPLPINSEIITREKESSLINIDASNFLLEILRTIASEIVIKADRIAQDGGRTTIGIIDIENAIHELNE